MLKGGQARGQLPDTLTIDRGDFGVGTGSGPSVAPTPR